MPKKRVLLMMKKQQRVSKPLDRTRSLSLDLQVRVKEPL